MRKNSIWLAFLILGLVVAGDAWAQGLPTATLAGKVINEGQGLPGVSVTVKSPNLQGTRTTVTSGNGDYTFVSLPAGRYTVSFALSGFQPVVKQVDLSGSQTSTLNASISLTAVAAEATVVGRAENISEATQASSTITSETMNKLPVARTMLAAVTLAPGLNENGPRGVGYFTISGAMSYENLFLVNGANIADNVRSNPTNLFVEDAIQETTISTSGISAEYGRFAGGVVNTITKSGGNAFSGSLRTSFDDAAWAATKTKGTDGLQKLNETYEATFGGPILKDKVWFFASGRYAKTAVTYTTPQTLISVDQPTIDKRWEGKLTISPLQNHTFTGSYLSFDQERNNTNFPPSYTLASFYNGVRPSDFQMVNYNGVLTSNFFVEGQYSQKHYTFKNSGSSSTGLLDGTVIYDSTNGVFWNSPVFCAVCPGGPEKRDNQDGFAKATYFLSTPSIGSMNIVAGYDQFRGHHISNNWQSGNNFFLYSDDTHFIGQTPYPQFTSGASYLLYNPIFKLAIPSNMRTDSFFLNDAWKINNMLSFNLGVRYDKNNAADMDGIVKQNDSAWSPRLGVTVDPMGAGTLRFNASYARYVSAVQDTLTGGASSSGNPSYFYYLYGGDDINTSSTGPWLSANDAMKKMYDWWGITARDMFPTKNLDSLSSASYSGLNQKIASGMVSPHTDEVALGVAGSVGPRLTYRADATYRKGGGFLEAITTMQTGQVTDPYGNAYDVHVTQNGGSEYERLYYGLGVQFAYRPVDTLSLGGSWTWSHAYGTFVGENFGSGPINGNMGSYPEYHQNSWYSPRGDLSQDQRHRVRIFGSYDLPLPKAVGNLSFGGIFMANSGTPYSAVGSVKSSSYVTNPGYATPPTNSTYYFSGRGEFTTEAWYQLDLSLNYSYDIGPVQLFVQPQVLNVLNAQHMYNNLNLNTAVYTNVNKSYLKKFNPFTTDPNTLVECPATATAAQCTAMGANWQESTTFGQSQSAAAYQTPRTFRLSVGVRF